ncbi:probable G-protein coupled receptor 141 [Psammomys obesus]|uniref:probable G-protein coupled receptor 141 n=1 Tax=Psammomys obesus TaxID=48139 RepID=UPI002452CAFF|nr:probable G-protein coupled receptor 141 [Psammomys obesus]
MDSMNVTTVSNGSRVVMPPAEQFCDAYCRAILTTAYSVVLFGGTAGAVLMSHMMFKRKSHSAIATIIINIIVLHSFLLLSLPFRLSYYLSAVWKLGSFTCRVVSGVIYGHMYLTFVFYVAIVILRLLIYFRKLQTQQLQKFHAVVLSVLIWMAGSLIFLPIFFLQYGTDPIYTEQQRCFEFHRSLNCREIIIINYSIIVIMMTTVLVLFLIQLPVILRLIKAYWPDMRAHQEYRAQIKSFFFLLVIVVCFIPHHAFRVYFIQNYPEQENSKLILYNEICVALTAFCCLDMLCFIGGVIH